MASPAWCFSRDARPLPSQPDTATPVPAPAFAGNSLASQVVAVYFSPFLAHFVFAESLAVACRAVSPTAPSGSGGGCRSVPNSRVLPWH